MFAPIERVVAWLREGYPQGIPTGDYIPLVALLRRRLSEDEIKLVGRRLNEAGMLPADESHVGAELLRLMDEVPAVDEIRRVSDQLRAAGLDIARPSWERPEAPVVHLLYGLHGSGKTAVARAIEEEEDALRFSLDEWLQRLYPGVEPGSAADSAARGRVLAVVRETALQALRAGCDVVFDWNAWSRQQRAWAKELADQADAVVLVHALSAGAAEIEQRRWGGASASRHVPVTLAGNAQLAEVMEPITADEGVELITH